MSPTGIRVVTAEQAEAFLATRLQIHRGKVARKAVKELLAETSGKSDVAVAKDLQRRLKRGKRLEELTRELLDLPPANQNVCHNTADEG